MFLELPYIDGPYLEAWLPIDVCKHISVLDAHLCSELKKHKKKKVTL